MDTPAEKNADPARNSLYLARQLHHQCRLPPASATTVHCNLRQLFRHVDHLAVPGRPPDGRVDEVGPIRYHRAPATTTSDDENENSAGSNDSVPTSGSRVGDVTAASRDAANDKLTRFQRPEHRQVSRRQFLLQVRNL